MLIIMKMNVQLIKWNLIKKLKINSIKLSNIKNILFTRKWSLNFHIKKPHYHFINFLILSKFRKKKLQNFEKKIKFIENRKYFFYLSKASYLDGFQLLQLSLTKGFLDLHPEYVSCSSLSLLLISLSSLHPLSFLWPQPGVSYHAPFRNVTLQEVICAALLPPPPPSPPLSPPLTLSTTALPFPPLRAREDQLPASLVFALFGNLIASRARRIEFRISNAFVYRRLLVYQNSNHNYNN